MLPEAFRGELAASVGVKNNTFWFSPGCDGGIKCVNRQLCINPWRNLVRDDLSCIQIHYCTEIKVPRTDAYVRKIAHPSRVRSRLIELLRQNIIAISVFVFMWTARLKRLNSTHLGQIHGFHQAVHSSAADAYAIITLQAQGDFAAAEPLVCLGI